MPPDSRATRTDVESVDSHDRGAEIRLRLRRLYELRVLERFPRPKVGEGSHPYHWILDEAVALLVADWKGIDRRELRYTRDDGQGRTRKARTTDDP